MNGISLYRIGALALRYLYLFRSSRIRIIELAYWPTVRIDSVGLHHPVFDDP